MASELGSDNLEAPDHHAGLVLPAFCQARACCLKADGQRLVASYIRFTRLEPRKPAAKYGMQKKCSELACQKI
ncbi:hypothetical protein QCE63_29300 [Caballeronia sp. LZ065]|uniref:hypothetical protein n=1 Tax=Caballeronia sp. LZ065 TaxID=3038571 RepID=UPI00285E967B|nr:hypothetical protein [Caballeronia sp. LZ065]MDR5783513.1 hypothetical protein [Caballeronia sp. LZ065]